MTRARRIDKLKRDKREGRHWSCKSKSKNSKLKQNQRKD